MRRPRKERHEFSLAGGTLGCQIASPAALCVACDFAADCVYHRWSATWQGRRARPINRGPSRQGRRRMRILTRLAAAAAIVAIGAGAAAAKDWKTVRIAMDATYPPFESLDASSQIVGFDKDIADALCDADEGDLRVHQPGLGRHHPGAARQQVRCDPLVDVDHRGAQAADRLHAEILQHPAGDRRAERLDAEGRRRPTTSRASRSARRRRPRTPTTPRRTSPTPT